MEDHLEWETNAEIDYSMDENMRLHKRSQPRKIIYCMRCPEEAVSAENNPVTASHEKD